MAIKTVKLNKTAQSLENGTDEIAGSGQVITVQVVGTFEVGDGFNLRLGESNYGYMSKPVAPISFLLTLGKKLYAINDTLLQFSEIDNAEGWDTEFDLGAGFINMFNEFTGGERLSALATYGNRLGVFARRTIQIWTVDVDPSRNSQQQILNNVGTLAPRSVTSIGDVDVFFLADSGIRSLRSRDINNIAFSADIGNPVDELVIADIRTLGADASNALGVIDPTDGRYWLFLGDKIYVFSHFASSKVAAWSTYEPGFTTTDVVTHDGRVWLRDDDDNLYLYGGEDNDTYDDCEVSGVLPFLSAGTPATLKSYTAFDAVVENEWAFTMGTNPEDAEARDEIGRLWAPSFDMRRLAVSGYGTHFSIAFSCAKDGYARLSNVIVHYTPHEAG
jgi:hypothetical protein